MEYKDAEISLLFTNDTEIATLNEEYRSKVGPTDVLSFAMTEGEGQSYAGNCLGDVVISVETAIRQAPEHGLFASSELLRLIIHGTLHLLGYDHENVPEEEAERMRAKEDELFALLGTHLAV